MPWVPLRIPLWVTSGKETVPIDFILRMCRKGHHLQAIICIKSPVLIPECISARGRERRWSTQTAASFTLSEVPLLNNWILEQLNNHIPLQSLRMQQQPAELSEFLRLAFWWKETQYPKSTRIQKRSGVSGVQLVRVWGRGWKPGRARSEPQGVVGECCSRQRRKLGMFKEQLRPG